MLCYEFERCAHFLARKDCAACRIRTAERRVKELEAEEGLATSLIARQALILEGVANALKGEPGPLQLHSTHDLPEVAERVITELGELRHRIGSLEK